jgi:hypothetical protein
VFSTFLYLFSPSLSSPPSNSSATHRSCISICYKNVRI